MDDRAFLRALPEELAGAVGPSELEAATSPPDGSGVRRSINAAQLRVDDRLLPGPVPDVRLELGEPVDAHELGAAWGVHEPVAVSPDVHQRTWSVLVAGEELADPHGRRIASGPITAGRWEIVPGLRERPAGDLPDVVSGASPAYDLRERTGLVVSIEIRAAAHETRTLDPGHPDARELLGAMAFEHPVWRGGWEPDGGGTFVAVYAGGAPIAGGAMTDAGGDTAWASHLCIAEGGAAAGAPLLDALEAVATDRGSARLRIDSSAFLLGDALPYASYGYTVGPPYEGDPDAEVWVEKAF